EKEETDATFESGVAGADLAHTVRLRRAARRVLAARGRRRARQRSDLDGGTAGRLGGPKQAGTARSPDVGARVALLGGVHGVRGSAGCGAESARFRDGGDGDVARGVAAQMAALPRPARHESKPHAPASGLRLSERSV